MKPIFDSSVYVLTICLASMVLLFVITAIFNYLRAPTTSASCHAHFMAATKIVNAVAVVALIGSALFGDMGYVLAINVIYGMVVINSAAFFLWHFFALTDVSMHIHLLVEIYRAERISREALYRRYNKEAIIRARIPRLIALHQLSCRDGILRVSGKAVFYNAWLFAVFRIVLGIPKRPVLPAASEWRGHAGDQ